jgi:hypothetical protein
VLKLNVAILNALWHIITGQKLEYDDPNLKVSLSSTYIRPGTDVIVRITIFCEKKAIFLKNIILLCASKTPIFYGEMC